MHVKHITLPISASIHEVTMKVACVEVSMHIYAHEEAIFRLKYFREWRPPDNLHASSPALSSLIKMQICIVL